MSGTGIIISCDHRRTVIRCFFPNKYCSTCHFYYLLSSVLSILPRHKKFCLFLTPFRHHPSPQQCRQNSFSGFPRARYLLYHHKNLPEDSVRLPVCRYEDRSIFICLVLYQRLIKNLRSVLKHPENFPRPEPSCSDTDHCKTYQ